MKRILVTVVKYDSEVWICLLNGKLLWLLLVSMAHPHINSENTTSAVMIEMITMRVEESEDMFSAIINAQSPITATPTVLPTTATPPVTPSTNSVLSTISSATSFTVTASTTIPQSTISSSTSDISANTSSSSDIYTVSTTSEMLVTTKPAGRPLVGIVLGCVIPAVVILLALAVFIACCCHYWYVLAYNN